jgi:RNA polymerase-interacting CarD/CdnL/TRCF family regulator
MFRPGDRVIYRNEGWFVIGQVTEVVMADGPIQAVALHPVPARKDGLVIRIPVRLCQPPLVRVPLPSTELDTVLERLGSRSFEEDTVLEDVKALVGDAYAIGHPMVQAKILQGLCSKNRAALTDTERRLWDGAYGALAFEIGAVRHLSRPKAKQMLDGILREAAHRKQHTKPAA